MLFSAILLGFRVFLGEPGIFYDFVRFPGFPGRTWVETVGDFRGGPGRTWADLGGRGPTWTVLV